MNRSTVVIPNYNGIAFLEPCLLALEKQTAPDFTVILVDNGSADGSREYLEKNWMDRLDLRIVALSENFGFCRAVNEGIRVSDTPYVILLNNDTEVFPEFVEELICGMERHPKAFAGQALMLQLHRKDLTDSAGDLYSAFGWAFSRGKDRPADTFVREEKIFSACGGAAIYRKKILDEIGLFDEAHFAYLEDLDLCYRAKIHGYENWFFPEAKVYHVGSGASGSRHNAFKIRLSAANNVRVLQKNMPFLQKVLNGPFLLAGFGIKCAFFQKKGFGDLYRKSLKVKKDPDTVVPFRFRNLKNYLKIQGELWKNMFLRR